MTDSMDLDLTAVDKWLTANLDGYVGPSTAVKIKGGQSNPTYRLSTGAREYVLRRKPPGMLLKSAHAVDREFRVQNALLNSNVPVANMRVLCEDDDVIGSAFYVMDFVDGRGFNTPSLSDVARHDRAAIFDEMNRVLAAIHDIDINATGLSDYGPEGNYYQRQIDRWSKQYRASQTSDIADMEKLMTWLGDNIPADDGQRTLVHGDFRIDNMLFAHDGPQCLAVLDWELSTIGHPYADLASVIMQWAMPEGGAGRGLQGLDRTAEGLWSDEKFIATYCQRRGIDGIDNFGFYLAFCFFRMASIIQGVLKRALEGNASDPERGKTLGAYVPVFAAAGLKARD